MERKGKPKAKAPSKSWVEAAADRAEIQAGQPETAKRGRPTAYTPELAHEICRRLTIKGNLKSVCKSDDMPPEATVRMWALDDYQGFSALYAKAREIGYLSMADDIMDIADDSSKDVIKGEDGEAGDFDREHINRSRLRVDTRKWLLSKCLPKIYGDKIVQEHVGKDGGPIEMTSDSERAKALAVFLAKTMPKKD